jgi:hypothetical protein
MPIYVYENSKGERLEEIRLAKDKNKCPDGYHRVEAPQPIAFTGNAGNPTSMKDGVMRGYYQEECKNGSRWKSDFSKKQIKKAWSE